MLVVLGLDLSLTSTGIAVVRDGVLLTTTNIPTSSKEPWIIRVKRILNIISNAIDSYQPDMAYIEDYSFDAKFGREVLGELHGVVMYYLTQRAIPYHKVSPVQVKQFATGRGKAPAVPDGVAKSTWKKRWVVEAVNARYDMDFKVSENDKVDAFLLALLGYYVEEARQGNTHPLGIQEFQNEVVKNILHPSEKVKGGNKNGKGKSGTQGSGIEQPGKRGGGNCKKFGGR